MRVWLGLGLVIFSITAGCMISGINLAIFIQPSEYCVILGIMAGAYLISNSPAVVKQTIQSLKQCLKGPQYQQEHYIELLSVLFLIFKLIRSKGSIALEAHIDQPMNSALLSRYPFFLSQTHAVNFTCDYLRIISMGETGSAQVQAAMQEELESYQEQQAAVPHALREASDGLPALGIVAAVLGVIHTMKSISESPKIIGALIASALVGTLSGVVFSYGIVGPLGNCLSSLNTSDEKYLFVIKAALIAHMNGAPPFLVVEYARKVIGQEWRPPFGQMEKIIEELDHLPVE